MNGCKLRHSARVVGESDMDRINGDGGETLVVDSQSSTQSNVNKNRNVTGQRHKVAPTAGLEQ